MYRILGKFILFVMLPLLFFSCGSGDDDGRRLGEQIVGTWTIGSAEEDFQIGGDTEFTRYDFSFDHFMFRGDGSYNGMVRSGTFSAYDEIDEVIYEGDYRCDNNNLRMEYVNVDGQKMVILARVLSFTDESMNIQYVNDDLNITVTMRLYHSSSTASAE